MRRPVGLLISALAALLAASCFQYAARPLPLFEAARRPDDSARVAGGLNGGTGMLWSHYVYTDWWHSFREVRCDRFAAGEGVFVLEGGKDKLKRVLVLGLGLARMTDRSSQSKVDSPGNPVGVSRTAFPVHFAAGCKIAVGEQAAMRLTLGQDFCFLVPDTTVENPLLPLPSADIFYLRDLGSRWTAGAGVGVRGLQLNGVHHLPVGRKLGGNIAVNLLYYGWPVRWSAEEPGTEVPLAVMVGITVGRSQ